MEIRISNLLDMQLTNEDVQEFINVFGTLKDAIHSQDKKVGFKKNGTISLDLTEENIEFIVNLCNSAGIMSETEISEQQNQEIKG